MDAAAASSSSTAAGASSSVRVSPALTLARCQLCGHHDRAALAPSVPQPTAATSARSSPIAVDPSPLVSSIVEQASSSSSAAAAAPPLLRCTRCGLTSTYARADVSDSDDGTAPEAEAATLPPAVMLEAARAYRFTLLSEMADGPLPRDLAQIVVSYLLWYRAPQDFALGDLVDARDLRGDWMLARIEDIRDGKVLVHYLGFARRWDAWIDVQSTRLAPCHTHPKGKQQAYAAKLATRLSWPNKSKSRGGSDSEGGANRLDWCSSGATDSCSSTARTAERSSSDRRAHAHGSDAPAAPGPVYVSASALPPVTPVAATRATSGVQHLASGPAPAPFASAATAAALPSRGPPSQSFRRDADARSFLSASSSSSSSQHPASPALAAAHVHHAPPVANSSSAVAAYSVLTRPRPVPAASINLPR